MTTVVDFLPAAYRDRTARRAAAHERMLMAIPVVLALVAVDLVLRSRVHGIRQMAVNASLHAADGLLLGEESKALATRVATLQSALDALSRPLAAGRMTVLLDELLAGRPTGVHVHDLVVRHDPWATDSVPVISVDASCDTVTEWNEYLALLRDNDVLPPLQCQRTDEAQQDLAFAFHLENKTDRRQR